MAGEDPLAINLIIHSVDKVERDLFKKRKLDDFFSREDIVSSEHLREFFKIYREVSNFLKHADKIDPEKDMPIHEVIAHNDLLIATCIIRFEQIYGNTILHMRLFMGLAVAAYPRFLDWEKISEAKEIIHLVQSLSNTITRSELLTLIGDVMNKDFECRLEKKQDLAEVAGAGNRALPVIKLALIFAPMAVRHQRHEFGIAAGRSIWIGLTKVVACSLQEACRKDSWRSSSLEGAL